MVLRHQSSCRGRRPDHHILLPPKTSPRPSTHSGTRRNRRNRSTNQVCRQAQDHRFWRPSSLYLWLWTNDPCLNLGWRHIFLGIRRRHRLSGSRKHLNHHFLLLGVSSCAWQCSCSKDALAKGHDPVDAINQPRHWIVVLLRMRHWYGDVCSSVFLQYLLYCCQGESLLSNIMINGDLTSGKGLRLR